MHWYFTFNSFHFLSWYRVFLPPRLHFPLYEVKEWNSATMEQVFNSNNKVTWQVLHQQLIRIAYAVSVCWVFYTLIISAAPHLSLQINRWAQYFENNVSKLWLHLFSPCCITAEGWKSFQLSVIQMCMEAVFGQGGPHDSCSSLLRRLEKQGDVNSALLLH